MPQGNFVAHWQRGAEGLGFAQAADYGGEFRAPFHFTLGHSATFSERPIRHNRARGSDRSPIRGWKPERGRSQGRGAPRSGLRSLTAVRAEATAVLASEANKGMAPLPHIELADSIPKKPAVKNFYAVWPKFVAIDLWRSGPNWTATMDQSHSAADTTGSVIVPAGTRLSVRTIDAIDSAKNHVGDRFEASLEEPLTVDGKVVLTKGASVYGRLEEAKTSGTFTGRSELRLALTEIVVNGQTVPLVSREYELSGKSRGASTAKRTVGGAAVGTIIGALAGGGKGAAIGAGVGSAAGAGSEIITKGDQVKVPSETLLDFTLQDSVSVPVQQN